MNLQIEISNLKQNALQHKKAHQKLIQDLKKLKPFDVDELFHTQHEEVFQEIDCLHCGNCCKTTPDLKISAKEFMQKYVVKDDDDDFVFRQTPCVFLGSDNYCSIYSVRPNACREYPHTNRKKMHQILDLTIKNAEICPAVARILDTIEESIQ